VGEEAVSAPAGKPVTKKADAMLDEALRESFPASDPQSTWSGLSEPEPAEETGGEPT
jgi:hypothetical protein